MISKNGCAGLPPISNSKRRRDYATKFVGSSKLISASSARMEASQVKVRRSLLLSRIGIAAATLAGLLAFYLYLRQTTALNLAGERQQQVLQQERDLLERQVRELREIYDEHDGLQDRFRLCGIVTPELAAKLGLTGLAGRASGQAEDIRCDFPTPPYDALGG